MNVDIGDTRLVISECKAAGLLRNQAAYVLATANHETAGSIEPIKETVMPYHKDKNPSDIEVKTRLTRAWNDGELPWVRSDYWTDGYFGRGYVQLTWLRNYRKARDEIGVDFVKSPDLVMNKKHAAKILVIGSRDGWFTGRSLGDYITLSKSDFINARRVINGVDRAEDVAILARDYDALLLADGYGVSDRKVSFLELLFKLLGWGK